MSRTLFAALAAAVALALLAPPVLADTVPDVVGLTVDKAKELLGKAKFEIAVTYTPAPNSVGKVISQDPGGLADRPGGSKVTITVVGPTPKPMPGGTPPVAPTQPAAPRQPATPGPDDPPAGTGVPDLGEPPSGVPPVAPVPSDPEPGMPPTGMPPAAPIPSDPGDVGTPPLGNPLTYEGKALPMDSLPNTAGPELPSVLGQQARQAQAALRGWQVSVEYTLGVPTLVGKVVNQRPYAGKTLARGELVTLVVAVAETPSRNHFGAPQLEQSDWRTALSVIQSSGFIADPRAVPSSDADRGKVLWQKPLPGSLVPAGATIVVRVGAGAGGGGTTAPAPANPPSVPVPPEPQPPVAPAPPRDPAPPPAVSQLGSPRLLKPAASESYPHRFGATFEWTAVSGASAYEWELQEELQSGAWHKVDSRMVPGPTYRPESIQPGRLRWRVRAVQGNVKSAWSDFQKLYMY